ncbi:MAG: NAD-dependent epimerase/dehydratase family protein [Thermodesulfobacteriota bacterium]|nr:MAG: NAD-dependent epimerase/dehydratase family protein [Thermodesulfobacteriota bacterium]
MKNNESITGKSLDKVLVTGGGGFLGSAIVRQLVERGDRVKSFSRRFYPELASLGVEQIQGDISDKTAVAQAFRGVNLVFHVAAKPGVWGDYLAYYRTNVIGTQNVISACKKHNVLRLVYTSSPSVVFDGTDMEGIDESAPYPEKFHAHYPKTKAMAEQAVMETGDKWLKTIILRPHLIWGPQDNHLIPRIIQRANRLVKVGNGKNLVDTIYIDNAADAHIQAADRLEQNHNLSGRVYFISQDDPLPLWDMVNNILKAAGLVTVRRSISRNTAWMIGAVLEIFYKMFKISGEPRMTRFLADELSTAHWFDISAAKKDFGYVPKISTEEGLSRLERWLQHKPEIGKGK